MGFLRDDLVAAAGRGARLCAERAAGERYALSWRLQSVCVSEGRRLFRADIVDAAANALIRRVASRVASHARATFLTFTVMRPFLVLQLRRMLSSYKLAALMAVSLLLENYPLHFLDEVRPRY